MANTNPSSFTRSTAEVDIDTFNQWLRQRPFWAQIRGGNTGDLTDGQRKQLESAIAAQGITLPKEFHVDEGGNLNQKSRVKGRLLKTAIIGGAAAGAIFGAPALMGAFGAGGGAGAGGAAGLMSSSAVVPGAALGAGGGLGAAAGTAAAAGAGHGIFSSLVAPALIKGGGDVLNGVLAHRAAGKASDQLVAASERAQGINDQVHRETQASYAPYMQGGQGAFGMLTQGLGLPQPPQAPQGAQPQANTGRMVTIQAPNGQQKQVSESDAAHFISRGATLLSGAAQPAYGSMPGDGTIAGRNNPSFSPWAMNAR